MCKVLSNSHWWFLRYYATCENHPLFYKKLNKSKIKFLKIIIKKYTDLKVNITKKCVKFQAIIINLLWDMARHVNPPFFFYKNLNYSKMKFWIITKKYTDFWIILIKKCVKFKVIIRNRFWATAQHVKNTHPYFSYKVL